MCGIAGILTFDSSPVAADTIHKMTDAIRHRGPDDQDIYLEGSLALGHRRLSIIDLSPGGHQPMAGPDGSTHIVYNGEIYNYLDLRAELVARGHQFKSHSDTEVILHAYQEYGCECLSRLNGMFALALWDSRQRRLFLARDRMGVKPLYFYRDARRLIFASEIKAILAALESTPTVNHRLLYDFLTLGVLDHTDETFFAGIHKLPAAHGMLIEPNGQAQVQRYWDFEVSNEVARLTDSEVERRSQAFWELFTDAVQLRLVSDVPVGSCLSGGLDSSAVVSVIARLIRQNQAVSVGPRQQTFSACYPNAAIDEQCYMDQAVQWTGAQPWRVFPQPQKFIEDLPQLIWHQEEPFAGASIYAQWEVMRLAREKGIIVLLDGQGADEQLLGYRKFYAFYVQTLLRQGQFGAGLRESLLHFGNWNVLRTLQLRRGLRYLQGRRMGSRSVADRLLRDSFAASFRAEPLNIGVESTLAARIKSDLTRFSLPVLLRYEDKNSMAFGRESRVPFLDYRLVEYVAGLPLNLKLRDGWTKYCLRRGGRGYMPDMILRRRDKIGFAAPEDEWFRRALQQLIRQAFESALFLPHLVNVQELVAQFDAFCAGRRPLLSGEFFFRFFIVERWAQVFQPDLGCL